MTVVLRMLNVILLMINDNDYYDDNGHDIVGYEDHDSGVNFDYSKPMTSMHSNMDATSPERPATMTIMTPIAMTTIMMR